MFSLDFNSLDPGWQKILQEESTKPYFRSLSHFLDKELQDGKEIYPPKELIFNAFKKTPLHQTKVVIVGQDPYHGPGQAEGLCFSVAKGIPHPPSLKNIFKELAADVGVNTPDSGSLIPWAEQGVLLLNATLTVARGIPMSHHGKGWEIFTDAVIRALVGRKEPIIFVLWGKSAQSKCSFLYEDAQTRAHSILVAPHPSPFSADRGFFGAKPFSKINRILTNHGLNEINWNLLNLN